MRKVARPTEHKARIYPHGSGDAIPAYLAIKPDQLVVMADGNTEPVKVPLADCDIKLSGSDDRLAFVWRPTGDTIITGAEAAESLKSLLASLPPDVSKQVRKVHKAKSGSWVSQGAGYLVLGFIALKFVGFCTAFIMSFQHHAHSYEQEKPPVETAVPAPNE